jgi:hypothetical protein
VPRSQRVEHSLYGPRPLTLGECARASRLWWEARVFMGSNLRRSERLKNRRYGLTACTFVGREDEAEDINTLPLGVQWTCSGAKAV